LSLVLVADDDDAARSELGVALGKSGHRVIEAATAEETLRLARENEPDLLLLDVTLPDMEALALLEELRSETALARVPIMMMADTAEQDLLLRTFKWDIVDFLIKPHNMEVLLAKVGAHTRLSLAYKFSRRLSKEMYLSRIERLETMVQATEEDLSEAERHFTWMQPKPPEIEGYRIEVLNRPHGRLGGDFYDFVWLDRDRLAVVVGDVSGHGVQAAILQAMARKLVSVALRLENGDLHRVVDFANRELTYDLPPSSFVATAIGVLNARTHEWRHVRCGVPYPMVVLGTECEPVVTPGGPLGLSKRTDWHVQVGDYHAMLEPGMSVLMLSDGIIECPIDDDKKVHFEVEGIVAAVAATRPGESVIQIIEEMADLEHRADDDATLISITRVE
jgi:phosphoserine phosphatase RsbU/P